MLKNILLLLLLTVLGAILFFVFWVKPVGEPEIPIRGADSVPKALAQENKTVLSQNEDDFSKPIPVELSLRWVEPTNANIPTPRSTGRIGRSARFVGRVQHGNGAPAVGAKLRFDFGLNQGEEAIVDNEGKFEFSALYPGLHQIWIDAGSGNEVLREIRLMGNQENSRDFSFDLVSTVAGRVVDRKGKPVARVELSIDRKMSWSDEQGHFSIPGVLPGDAILYAKAEGYAWFRQNLTVLPGVFFEPDKLQIVLAPGGTLRGGAYATGSQNPALLYLVPGLSSQDRSIPFEKFSAIPVGSGGSFEIPHVPIGTSLNLLAFHSHSVAEPNSKQVLLRENSRNVAPIEFRFRSVQSLRGKVQSAVDGKPIPNAKISLLCSNPEIAVAHLLKAHGPAFGSMLLPLLPSCEKETISDSKGEFSLEAGDGGASDLLLRIEADGFLPYEKKVSPTNWKDQAISLFPPQAASSEGGELQLQFRSARPVAVSWNLNGSQKELQVVQPSEFFSAPSLRTGIYQIDLQSGARRLFPEKTVSIAGTRKLEISIH